MTAADVLQWWSFLFLGVFVYYMGNSVKRAFPSILKQTWYKRTIVFHPAVIAPIIAVMPIFPMPSAIGDEIGTRILFGLVAGICSAWSYKAVMRLLGKDTSSKLDAEIEDTKP